MSGVNQQLDQGLEVSSSC